MRALAFESSTSLSTSDALNRTVIAKASREQSSYTDRPESLVFEVADPTDAAARSSPHPSKPRPSESVLDPVAATPTKNDLTASGRDYSGDHAWHIRALSTRARLLFVN